MQLQWLFYVNDYRLQEDGVCFMKEDRMLEFCNAPRKLVIIKMTTLKVLQTS